MDPLPSLGAARIVVLGVGDVGCAVLRSLQLGDIEAYIDCIAVHRDVYALVGVPARDLLTIEEGLFAESDRLLANTDMLVMAGSLEESGELLARIASQVPASLLTVPVLLPDDVEGRPFGVGKFDLPRGLALNPASIVDLYCRTRAREVLPPVQLFSRIWRGVFDVILMPGVIGVDFADVRQALMLQGRSVVAVGTAAGSDRAAIAAEEALDALAPWMPAARGVICVVLANDDLGLDEFTVVGERLNARADPGARVIIGTARDVDMGDRLQVVLLATGLSPQVGMA
jgi:hypothetical protein